MLLTNQLDDNEADQMIAFYKNTFNYVAVVYCNKCENPVAVIVGASKTGDNLGLQFNDIGQCVIPVGEHLKSSRVRLDLTPTGERMYGFQCKAPIPNPVYPKAKKEFDQQLAEYEKDYAAKVEEAKAAELPEPEYLPPQFTVQEKIACGNDTRLAKAEVGLVPVGASPVNYANPFEKHKIMQELKNNETKADFEEHGHIRRYETFRVERV